MHGMKMRYRPILLLTMALLSGCDAAPEPDSAPRSTGPVERVPGSPSPIDDGSIGGVNAAEPRAEPVISEPFRGRWAMTPADCRAGSAEESRLGRIIVGASEIQFVHASGEPLSVMRRGDAAIAVRLLVTRNESSVERTDRLTIDPDGTTLRYRLGDEDLTYHRCPIVGPDPSRGDEGPYRPTRRSAPLRASDPPVPGLPVMFPFEQKKRFCAFQTLSDGNSRTAQLRLSLYVMPAKAGISGLMAIPPETPAFAGVTKK